MSSFEEPPLKKQCTSYELCVFCQEATSKPLVNIDHVNFKCTSYETFLNSLHKRAQLGSSSFVTVSKRLRDVSAVILKEKRARWHKSCYSSVTNRAHIKRDEVNFSRSCASQKISNLTNRKRGRPSNSQNLLTPSTTETTVPTVTRSHSQANLFFRHKCFFCQKNTDEALHPCSSVNRGSQLTEIVNKSLNKTWKIHLGDVITSGDLLARDIMYHERCYTCNWEKYIQRPQRKKSIDGEVCFETNQDKNIKVIAAEVEFTSIIQQKIDEGEFILMPVVHRLYKDIFQNHDIGFDENRRLYLTEKLEENLENIKITSSSGKPSIVHSSNAGAAAIRTAADEEKNMKANFKLLFQSGKIIREAITKSRQSPWKFEGSLKDSLDVGIPAELLCMLRWIIQGVATTKTHQRTEGINRSCALIGQHIIQEFKSDRQIQYEQKSPASAFRFKNETPLGVGLSLHSHHAHRSRKDIEILYHTGIGVSYQRVKEITSKIATTVQENIKKFNGIYVPPELFKNLPIRCSADNIDAKVDTVDGRNTFHGTALGVYQRIPQDTSECETVTEPLKLHDKSTTKIQNILSTVTEMSDCAITGNPKPSKSPRYENFSLGQFQDKVIDATQQDLVWLISRYSQRNHEVESDGIPVWSAYNSRVYTTENNSPHLDQDHTMPIIKAPAHEWITLVTILEKLFNLNRVVCSENPGKVLVTFDMDLYKRAIKLEYLNDQFAGKWMLCPGGFHTVLCAIRCLGRTVEHSGLDEAWSKDLYSSVTVNQILNGNHHNRAIEAHELTLEAFFDLWYSEFVKENAVVVEILSVCVDNLIEANKKGEGIKEAHQKLLVEIEHLNLEKQLMDFDRRRSEYPMYQWARMYMRQVLALMNFTRSLKQPDLLLYLASLENLCIYFFSYNRLDYAQNIPEYIARVCNTKDTDPIIWNRLQAGDFALTKKEIPFTSVAVDQGQEFLNKVIKGEGGLKGITNKPSTLLKYCLCAPVLAKMAMESETMIGMSTKDSVKHHHLSVAKFTQRENMLNKLLTILKDCNPFCDKSPTLHNLMTKQVVPKKVENDILNMEFRGKQALNSFVEQRICGPTNLWDRMTKVKYLNWDEMCKTLKVKSNKGEIELKATNTLFARLLMIAKSSREVDLQDIISNYEFTAINSNLMKTDGSLITSDSKSDLIHVLEGLAKDVENNSVETTDPIRNTILVIDGMSVVNEVMSAMSPKTCEDMGDAFIKTINCRSKSYEGCRVIFDNYNRQNSIKDNIRYNKLGLQSLAKSYIIGDTTPINDTKQFMANNETKDSLTIYLADKVLQLNIPVVTVTRQGVTSNKEDIQPSTGVSTQEEADTLIILHAAEISAAGNNVHIMTQDTDVMILALRRLPILGPQTTMIMGTGNKRRKVLLKPIFDNLGPSKAAALPGFHCITGCDTCGHIKNKGKKSAFKAFNEATLDEVTALAQLGNEEKPSEDVISGCEQFLCRLMSTKKYSSRTAGELRWKCFKNQPSGIDKIPPTSGAWYQHILRAHMQAYIWNQDLVENPHVPDLLKLGWSRCTNDIPVPTLSEVLIAPEFVIELVRCGCGISKCSRKCTCRQNNLTCTESCECGADEECANTGYDDVLQPVEDNADDLDHLV